MIRPNLSWVSPGVGRDAEMCDPMLPPGAAPGADLERRKRRICSDVRSQVRPEMCSCGVTVVRRKFANMALSGHGAASRAAAQS